MISEFKKFLMRGNVIDLAVGIIIGGAFQAIVTSLVDNIITPLLSIFLKEERACAKYPCTDLKEDGFSSLAVTIPNTAATIQYGAFITAIINFFIMALVVFLIVKFINKASSVLQPKEAEVIVVTTKKCPYCFSEINKEATKCPHCTSDVPVEAE